MRLGVIGTGTIASALVTGIAADGHDIWVSDRGADNASRLAARFANVTIAGNQAVIDQSDVIFIGLMADIAPAILGALTFRAEQRVVSLMAGPSLSDVCDMVPPARVEALAIPFPSIAQGGSVLMTYPQSDLLQALFGVRNHLFAMADPDEMATFLAAQAVLSPVLTLLDETASWMARRTGDPARSDRFVRLLTSASLSAQPPQDAAVLPLLLQQLDTAGGLNAQLRDFMAARGMGKAIGDGLNHLETRLKDPS